jgi:hypothetical protein
MGVENITDASLALGGQLKFEVDNLGGVASPVTRWLQVNVDNANTFIGRAFGSTSDAALVVHADDPADPTSFTTTIPAGTTELDLFFVMTVDFGGTPVPNAVIARVGSFVAEFTPDGTTVTKGDVDLSGTVDFADIPAFIAVLQSGGFQAEADCDCSTVVDFADIPAFIAILQGG